MEINVCQKQSTLSRKCSKENSLEKKKSKLLVSEYMLLSLSGRYDVNRYDVHKHCKFGGMFGSTNSKN